MESGTVSTSLDALSADIYRSAVGIHGEANFMVSPVSIMYATLLLYFGAGGKTKSQMFSGLHLNKTFQDQNADIAGSFGDLMKQYDSSKQGNSSSKSSNSGFQLDMANGFFLNKNDKIKADFRTKVAGNLGAEVLTKDLRGKPEEARQDINKWVETKTGDKVKDLIPKGQITSDTRTVLVNAIYFKANWAHTFNSSLTSTRPFFPLNNLPAQVQMMTRTGTYLYARDSDLHISYVEIPYSNDQASMLLFVPRDQDGLPTLEKNFSGEIFGKMAAKARSTRGLNVTMPKFKMDVETDLVRVMKELGITDAFDSSSADLHGILAGDSLFVAGAFHKTHIDVDEHGTTAAGASASTTRTRTMPPKVVADHPFMFAIRHNPTKTILFIGRFESP